MRRTPGLRLNADSGFDSGAAGHADHGSSDPSGPPGCGVRPADTRGWLARVKTRPTSRAADAFEAGRFEVKREFLSREFKRGRGTKSGRRDAQPRQGSAAGLARYLVDKV